ncbi:hypothetical protein KP509_02G024500 [Ceratopteris richardii]|uniref:Uncharacterized protein n=1 Tax=Ceratopteris richardii TaxID=49495 RepID=A0A8T2V404_CERRI|nr:hypothetical protein KP509_02G024500 [Ceratopteris richardii]
MRKLLRTRNMPICKTREDSHTSRGTELDIKRQGRGVRRCPKVQEQVSMYSFKQQSSPPIRFDAKRRSQMVAQPPTPGSLRQRSTMELKPLEKRKSKESIASPSPWSQREPAELMKNLKPKRGVAK